MRKIDLSLVLLSPAAVAGWREVAKKAATLLPAGIDFASIPDEQAGILRNGNLIIFVEIEGVRVVSLEISASEWTYRMPQN